MVWKSTDHAHSWTRISPDLARQTWQVPATAGKYASTVTPAPLGSITALSLSPRSQGVIWAGTDDGNIQVTTDGGAKWTNVTPSAIKPWTRIFNIDAGHFDNLTAYAAANTMRIDHMNPHFWRTHDGGKTWTEINTGIAPGAVSNAIREDPRVRGLLYASTDLQVWVSYDDGDHWESMKYDMPAISVRDIQVKDDTTCLCADLVAGTHGRGYWMLDNLTPFRQAAEARKAQAAGNAYLFKPATAVRVRFGTNDPTPWPPELPAGENPLPGGIIDYTLAKDASAPVTLDIVDAGRRVVRRYSSDDRVRNPNPALDPVAYDKVCQQTPSAPDCAVPLYWPAAPIRLSTRAGFHRFTWDLHFDPIGEDPDAGDEGATGAVPHHTYDQPYSPWAPPGNYTVRLTVDGKQLTQPLTVRLDPRVKTSAAGLAQLASVTRETYDAAVAVHRAYEEARAVAGRLKGTNSALEAQIDSIAPAQTGGRRRPGFGPPGGGAAPSPTLESVSNALMAATMAMQGADVAPTAGQVATAAKARADARGVLQKWAALKAKAGSSAR